MYSYVLSMNVFICMYINKIVLKFHLSPMFRFVSSIVTKRIKFNDVTWPIMFGFDSYWRLENTSDTFELDSMLQGKSNRLFVCSSRVFEW